VKKLKENLLKVTCMLRKIFLIAVLNVLFAASLPAGAAVKEDLTSLYASALNNNWKRITAKTEVIIADFEKRGDIIKTQKQLTELEKFVVMNNLNPIKTKTFLNELRSVKLSLTHSLPKKKAMQPTVLHQVSAVQTAPITEKSFSVVWPALIGIFLVGIAGTWMIISRQAKRKVKNPVYAFEKDLSSRDLDLWKRISPSLESQQKRLGEVSIFSNEKLFALEFDYAEQTTEDDLVELKKVLSRMNAQLLLQSEWTSDQKFSRKLVLNFPVESVA